MKFNLSGQLRYREQTRTRFPGRAAIYGLWDLGIIMSTSQVLMWALKQMRYVRALGDQSAVTNAWARLSRPLQPWEKEQVTCTHTDLPGSASAGCVEGPVLLTCSLRYFGVSPQGVFRFLPAWTLQLLHSILYVLHFCFYFHCCGSRCPQVMETVRASRALAIRATSPWARGRWFLLCLVMKLASPGSCVSPRASIIPEKCNALFLIIYGCIKNYPAQT